MIVAESTQQQPEEACECPWCGEEFNNERRRDHHITSSEACLAKFHTYIEDAPGSRIRFK